jgi:hypothetical protein
MVTSQQAQKKYGLPSQSNPFLILWDIPSELEIGVIPKRIYTNTDMVKPLEQAFKNLIERDHINELKTWDGCFNIRKKRGLNSMSLHSWGIAIDMNAFCNPLGLSRQEIVKKGMTPFSEQFLDCFRSSGFDCGADWKSRPDFMHMQLATI